MAKKRFSVCCSLTYTGFVNGIEAESEEEAENIVQKMLWNNQFQQSVDGIQGSMELGEVSADFATEY